jgi:hypothetical protein
MLKCRLTTLTRHLSAIAARVPPDAADPVAEARERFLGFVPADLRPAITERLRDPAASLAGWYLWPFAPWARVPEGFTVPPVLVRFVLDTPPGELLFLHACGRCGLSVPLRYEGGSLYPAREPPFPACPACPACGGRTSFSAHYARQEGAA